MKPLSEWTMGDLIMRLAGDCYPTPTHPAADVLAELLRRERKKCEDAVLAVFHSKESDVLGTDYCEGLYQAWITIRRMS